LKGIVSKRLGSRYTSGPTHNWVKVNCAAWKREHVETRRRLFEKPPRARAPSEREKNLAQKRAELARVQERLQAPDVRPGVARELRKHVVILEEEIAELEA
jgi:hypothetical protein